MIKDLLKFYTFLSIVLLSFCFAGTVPTAYAQTVKPLPFKVKASAAVLLNAVSGQHLCAHNADKIIPPASLTKIMTLYIAYDAVDNGYITLDDEVRISEKAWRTEGSRMFLEVNSTVSLDLLLQGIAVVSANDACVAVAEYIADAEEVFVESMNKKAAELGLTDTVFKNSHGLPADGQHSTARDMAVLAYRYMIDHPEVLKKHAIKKMTYNKITQRNRNGLLWLDRGVDGLKTGWFNSAGFHIIATAFRDNDRFIAVVLGAKGERQRENIALQMLNYGFRNYKTLPVFGAEETLATASVWKGAEGEVALGSLEPASVTVPRGDTGAVTIEKQFAETIFAPVQKNHEVGQLTVVVDGALVKKMPLVTLVAVEQAGVVKRALHSLTLFFVHPPYWGVFAALLICVLLIIGRVMVNRNKKSQENNGDFGSLL